MPATAENRMDLKEVLLQPKRSIVFLAWNKDPGAR